jgi:hypothetical protein
MQERGTFLTGRIFKLTMSINVSCLAKERCIPELHNSERKICIYTWRPGLQTERWIYLNCILHEKHYFWEF